MTEVAGPRARRAEIEKRDLLPGEFRAGFSVDGENLLS